MDDNYNPEATESEGEAKTDSLVPINKEVNFFAATNFRNQNRKFGIKLDDRRRHMYVVGKTGMGKTTLLENMVLNDIYAGHGVGLVDPHGDFAEKVLDYIPANRINDVVYFNPADINFPIGFNILETIRPEQKHLVASGLMGVFKKIWPDVWSARMEYILNNTILALIDFPGTTLLGINRMLSDAEYRKRVVSNSKDPVVKAFWDTEFAGYSEKFRTEAVAPIQNKIGQFLSASVIRNIVAQVKSRINIREIMDTKKIFIMNLSKGRIGEDNSRLLGGMLITRIQLAAMERVDIPEKERNDFFLYVDEFQNFATESFANILSEARKYRLDLIMAHQYMEQLEEEVMAAVIGNVGTMVTFRVGSTDAEILAKEFTPTFIEEDLVNLPKFQIYLKLMIDGVASRPFSATTLGPIAAATGSLDRVVRVSRERYATAREKIEEKIMRWSGLVPMSAEEAAAMEIDDEDAMLKHPPEEQIKKKEPVVMPPPAFPPKPANSAPHNAPRPQVSATQAMRPIVSTNNTFSNQSRPSGQNQSSQGGGDSRKRKHKNKNHGGGGGGNFNANPRQSESVLAVDPNQKGISLSQAIPESNHHETLHAPSAPAAPSSLPSPLILDAAQPPQPVTSREPDEHRATATVPTPTAPTPPTLNPVATEPPPSAPVQSSTPTVHTQPKPLQSGQVEKIS